MAYTRPAGTVLDFSDPGGDTYATAWDKNSDAVDSVLADLNTHEALTATHGATGAVVGTTNTQTLTNKTLTSPKINENVAVTATATEINKLTGCTSSTAELNKLTGLTPSTADLNQLAGATLTDPAFDAYADNAAALAGASAVLVMNPVRTKEAIAAFASPEVGQGRFDYVNATTARLNRYNGYLIKINGTFYAIPSAGVDFAVGASSSTFYYAYAYMDGATMKGELSATAPVADTSAGNEGVQIKTGDATRTLVGCVYMNSSTQFFMGGVASWFNQKKILINTTNTSDNSTSTSANYVQINSGLNIDFVTWGGFVSTYSGRIVYTSGDGFLSFGLDSTSAAATYAPQLGSTGVQEAGVFVFHGSTTIGKHTIAPIYKVSAGGTIHLRGDGPYGNIVHTVEIMG